MGMVTLVAVALGTLAVPRQWRRTSREMPPIHDIATDTDNPPDFVVLGDRRPGARNPVEYGGPKSPRSSAPGTRTLGPVTLPIPLALAVTRVGRDMGWSVAAVDTVGGRVEATDRTFWFDSYDDVVVRVTPAPAGARVHVPRFAARRKRCRHERAPIRAFLERLTSGS